MENMKLCHVTTGTKFYTIARNEKKIIPIVVTGVNENSLTVKSNTKTPTMFNCEGTFTFDEFIKMVGMSLFIEPVHAADWGDILQRSKFYDIDNNYDIVNDKASSESKDIVTDDELAKAINTLFNAIINKSE